VYLCAVSIIQYYVQTNVEVQAMNILLVILTTVAGGGFGYLVGKYLSRTSLGCPLLCNPKISMFIFALLGLLIAIR
jgi:hypothetical protein